MRRTISGCDVYVNDVLVAHRASVAYEHDRPGLLVIRARDEGVRVGAFHERIRADGVELVSSESSRAQRKITLRLLSTGILVGEAEIAAGSEIVCICTSGCTSCGGRR
jgi:hypothetical protein